TSIERASACVYFATALAAPTRRTFLASSPLGPCSCSYSTVSPSLSDRNPSPSMVLKWTKTSFPSALSKNPNPFFQSNHLTVPVGITVLPVRGTTWVQKCAVCCNTKSAGRSFAPAPPDQPRHFVVSEPRQFFNKYLRLPNRASLDENLSALPVDCRT